MITYSNILHPHSRTLTFDQNPNHPSIRFYRATHSNQRLPSSSPSILRNHLSPSISLSQKQIGILPRGRFNKSPSRRSRSSSSRWFARDTDRNAEWKSARDVEGGGGGGIRALARCVDIPGVHYSSCGTFQLTQDYPTLIFHSTSRVRARLAWPSFFSLSLSRLRTRSRRFLNVCEARERGTPSRRDSLR